MAPWIRTPEALTELARSLEGCRSIGLDTESDSLYHHFDKVCLVQIATDRGEAVLVDTLAVKDLSPLGPALADPAIVKILHGADYDVTTLKRDFGFAFANLFDTMIAARFLGMPGIGLAAVAGAELGVTLSKANQKDDWSRRPLTPQQEAYALADVQHLAALRERLEAKLVEKGRLEWVREECEAVSALDPSPRRKSPEAFLGIKGARKLRPRQLAALRELYAWREGRAERTDRPAFRILGNEMLRKLAERRPRTLPELRHVPGVLPRLRDQADNILSALRRAAELPDSELPVIPRSPRPVVSTEVMARGARLKEWRTRRAAELKVEVAVVLPQRLIDRLAAEGPRDGAGLAGIEGLRRWRIDAFGDELLAALAA
ncbi:MAG: ribonuclease D [Acidobacteria bacterium]|nr:ribonuclease D [Acidobacteriota bacterium]